MKKIVVVGTGIIGLDHINAIENSDKFELAALCDINEAAVEPLAKKYNVPYFLDYHDIPSKINADAVVLNLPALFALREYCIFLK